MDAEIEVCDEYTGARVLIRGGESAYVELDDKKPLTIHAVVPAQKLVDRIHSIPAPTLEEHDAEQRRKIAVKYSFWPYADGTFNKT